VSRTFPEIFSEIMERLIMTAPRTSYDQIWDDTWSMKQGGGTGLLSTSTPPRHEVTSRKPFEAAHHAPPKCGRPERRWPWSTTNVPTTADRHTVSRRGKPHPGEALAHQRRWNSAFEYFQTRTTTQGIVPPLSARSKGFTLPGTTTSLAVTATPRPKWGRVFARLAHGIGQRRKVQPCAWSTRR